MLATITSLGTIESFWNGLVDFFNPNIPNSEYVKTNLWDYSSDMKAQPNYVPAVAPAPGVPTGALDPSNNYHPYESLYMSCSPTDTDCLNRITNVPDANLNDVKQNVANYVAAQQQAIKDAEKAADDANAKPNYMPWLIGGAVVLLIVSKRK